MIKKSYLNIALVSFGNIFNTILGFVFLTVVARELSIQDFGKYALLTSLITFIARITDFGTNSLFVSKSLSQKQDIEPNLLNKFYTLKATLLLIVVPLTHIFLYLLGFKNICVHIIFILGVIAYTINFTIHSLLQRQEKYTLVIGLNSILAIIKLFFAILILTKVFTPTLINTFGIYALCVYPSLLLVYILPRNVREFKFTFNGIKNLFKEAFPAGISMLVGEGWSALASAITSNLMSFTNVGIYALADKLSTIFPLISFSIFTVLLPKNSMRKKQNLGYDFKETALISAGVIMLAIIGTIGANFVIVPIFGEHFKETLPILYILMFSSALIAINSFMENYFYVESKTKWLLPIATIKVVSFVGLTFYLYTFLGLQGIAYASLLSSILVTITTVVIIKKTL